MNQTLNDVEYYSTADLALTTALSCLGYQVEAIEKDRPHKATFFIKRDKNLNELVQSFFTHQLKVDSSTFFHHLKDLKTRIYQAQTPQ